QRPRIAGADTAEDGDAFFVHVALVRTLLALVDVIAGRLVLARLLEVNLLIGTHAATSSWVARVCKSGTSRSGVALAGGVAPAPDLPARRLTHTVCKPSDLAGTWSWNKLWATCT